MRYTTQSDVLRQVTVVKIAMGMVVWAIYIHIFVWNTTCVIYVSLYNRCMLHGFAKCYSRM